MEVLHCCASCRAPLEMDDRHRECPSCLGLEHLHQDLTDMACVACVYLSMVARNARLAVVNPRLDASIAAGGSGGDYGCCSEVC